jgi:hypothetical protein
MDNELTSHRTPLALIALLLVTVAAYLCGLQGSFFFDDHSSILGNPSLGLFDGTIAGLVAASGGSVPSPLGRPVSMASFALNLYFFGPGPLSFKVVNLIIHLINGILVFLLARRIWNRLAGQNPPAIAVLWIAGIWLLHPINLTAVLFTVQRMTSLAALFTLLALNLYLYGRTIGGTRGGWTIAAALLLCWPLGVLSKETAVLLPLFILLCEWLVLGGFRSMPRKHLAFAAAAAGIAAACALAIGWNFATAGYRFRDFSLGERLLTEARVLWFYVTQILLPLPDFFTLHHDDIPVSRGLLTPLQTLISIAAWLLLAALAFYRRRTQPLLAFGLGWFLAAHALESTILPLEIAYEHRNYLASIGVLIPLAGLLFSSGGHAYTGRAKLGLALVLILMCVMVTGWRAFQWGDEYRRTTAEAAAHPDSPSANYEAGAILVERTFLSGGGSEAAYQTARNYFQRSASLDARGKIALVGLLYLDCTARKSKDPAVLAELRRRFAEMPLLPADRGLIHSLSALLAEKRLCLEPAEIDGLLLAALSNPGADGDVRAMLHAVAMDYAIAVLKSPPAALRHAKAAVESDPASAPMRINLVRLLMATGDITAARREYSVLAQSRIPPLDRSVVRQLGSQLEFMERDRHAK